MLIGFDLDDTLVPCGHDFPTELARLSWLPGSEPLRSGTSALMRALTRAGHGIGVYTSSDRSAVQVRSNFLRIGILLTRVVNRSRHEALAKSLPAFRRGEMLACTKYPPAFGFGLLVDDSLSVARDGRRHGFRVVRIEPDDTRWCERVLRAVRKAG